MKAAPKFKVGDVIVSIEHGTLVATIAEVKPPYYGIMFHYSQSRIQPGAIAVFDESYMLEYFRNSPLNQELK